VIRWIANSNKWLESCPAGFYSDRLGFPDLWIPHWYDEKEKG